MKKIWKTAALMCLMLVLSGCMKMRVGIEIFEDETAEMTMDVLIEESTYELYGDSAFDDMLDQYEDEDADIEEIEEKHDGDTYIGYRITSYNDTANTFSDDYLEVYQEGGKEVFALTLDLDELYDSMDTMGYSNEAFSGYSSKQLKNAGVEMTMSFTMPYPITDASYGEIDGRTVTIDLFELMNNGDGDYLEITATEGSGGFLSFLGGNFLLFAAIGVIVLAAGAVVVIVIINNNNKKKAANNVDNIPVNSEPIEPKPTQSSLVEESVNVEEAPTAETVTESAETPVVEEITSEVEETVTESVETPVEKEVTSEVEETPTVEETVTESAETPVVEEVTPEVEETETQTDVVDNDETKSEE